MKVLLILTLFSFSAFAQKMCDQVPVSREANVLAKQSCEITDKMLSCAARSPIQNTNIKEKITKLLNNVEEKKEMIQKNWGQFQNTSLAWMFHFDPRAAAEDKRYIPTSIFDWMSAKNPHFNKEEFKKSVAEKYTKFAEENDCIPKIRLLNSAKVYPERTEATTFAELKTIINNPNVIQDTKNTFEKINQESNQTLQTCDITSLNPGPWQVASRTWEPCAGNITGHYDDNVWSRTDLEPNLEDTKSSALIECIKRKKAEGAKIHHISISSSASALNNTGKAKTYFCAKGFLGLAQARAEAAKNTLLPELFKKAGASYAGADIKMNYEGKNKDGTSGPCPYVLKDGKEVLKDEYRTPAGKKKLDENKYVKIQVTFESSKKETVESNMRYQPLYSCKQVRFECLPNK